MEFLQEHTFTAVTLFSVLTLIANILAVPAAAALLPGRITGRLGAWISRNGLTLMLIVALAATGGSLFFSEIAGWTPCKLCWWQRIFMYPQVLLLGIALWKRDRTIARSILVLSVIGMLIALYHYGEQVHASLLPPDAALEPCDATGESCARTEIRFHFGYITVPFMAFSAFLLNTLGSLQMLRRT